MRSVVARLPQVAHHDRAAPVGVGIASVLLFLLTSALARWHHEGQEHLAHEWSRRGDLLLQAGRAVEAADAFENALVHGPGDATYQYRLATALVAAGRDATARTCTWWHCGGAARGTAR
jgi:hypothetical protein